MLGHEPVKSISRIVLIALLMGLVAALPVEARAKNARNSKGVGRNAMKTAMGTGSVQYVLAFNQLVALPPKAQHNYLVRLQDDLGQLHRALEAGKQGKRGASHFNFFAASAWAQGSQSTKICMNLGYFKEDNDCKGDFDTSGESDEFSAFLFAQSAVCTDGTRKCNPAIFGPGVCAAGNNTMNCLKDSRRAVPPSGVAGLREALKECNTTNLDVAKKQPCLALQTAINDVEDKTKKVCTEAGQLEQPIVTICSRMRLAIERLQSESVLPLARTESSCKYVGGNTVVPNCAAFFGGGNPTFCVAAVQACPGMPGVDSDVKSKVPAKISVTKLEPSPGIQGDGLVFCRPSGANSTCPQRASECVKDYLTNGIIVGDAAMNPRGQNGGPNANPGTAAK